MASSTPIEEAGLKKRLARAFIIDVEFPAGIEVTSLGMSATNQSQSPSSLGESGSKQVRRKLLVSRGNPDQDSCGEILPPSDVCAVGSGCPSLISVLVNEKSGTRGSKE